LHNRERVKRSVALLCDNGARTLQLVGQLLCDNHRLAREKAGAGRRLDHPGADDPGARSGQLDADTVSIYWRAFRANSLIDFGGRKERRDQMRRERVAA
jgi:hypothetical protein